MEEKRTYHARTREDLIAIFNKHGRPIKVTSDAGSYIPYDTDSENDVFHEAMLLLTCFGADIVTVVYQ